MTASRPSQRIEALLASLGARAPYRDAVLGDLAEEHARRAESEGERAAARWYRREALRAAPHLLLDWARQLTPREVGRLAVIAIVSGATLRLLQLGIVAAVVASLGVVPDSLVVVNAAWRDVVQEMPVLAAMVVALVQLVPVAVGFVAAWTNARGRIPAALVVATAVAGSGMALLWFFVPTPLPLSVSVVAPLWLALRIVLGGVVCAVLVDRSDATAIAISR
jgi:hypothetical protein